jgi:hypothetical protein
MTTTVRIERLESVPVAVIRGEYARPTCRPDGVIPPATGGPGVGVERHGRFVDTGDVVRSATPAGVVLGDLRSLAG